jgi:hypothetical protein
VTDEFAAAHARLHVLAASIPEEWWTKRVDRSAPPAAP